MGRFTKTGKNTLDKPEFLDKPFETVLIIEKYCRIEQALINAVLKSYVHAVSIRNVHNIIEELGIDGVSAGKVSNIGKLLHERSWPILVSINVS